MLSNLSNNNLDIGKLTSLDSQQTEELFKKLSLDEKNINTKLLLLPIQDLLNNNPQNHKKLETIEFCIQTASRLINTGKLLAAEIILDLIFKQPSPQLQKQSKLAKYKTYDEQARKLKVEAQKNRICQQIIRGRPFRFFKSIIAKLDAEKYEFIELDIRNLKLKLLRSQAIATQFESDKKQLQDEKTTLITLENRMDTL